MFEDDNKTNITHRFYGKIDCGYRDTAVRGNNSVLSYIKQWIDPYKIM